MFSDDLPPALGPLGPEPIPVDVERGEMRMVLLRHRLDVDTGRCRACGNPPDHTGRCFAARVAYERLIQPD